MEVMLMINVNKILFPTDFSDSSKNAQKHACAFAQQFNSELHIINIVLELIYAVPPIAGTYISDDYHEGIKQKSNSELEQLCDNEITKELNTVTDVIVGVPHIEISRYAKDNDIDMIVMGTHGHTKIPEIFIGSVAERVVRNSPCPVMVVHPDDHQFIDSP
jgi:universal stress protein A